MQELADGMSMRVCLLTYSTVTDVRANLGRYIPRVVVGDDGRLWYVGRL